MSYTYKYPRPSVSADAAVFRVQNDQIEILLIRRANPPFKGMWALPGGFVDMDEDLETAAARELKEETGVEGIELKQFHAYGAVERDPRHRTISISYAGLLTNPQPGIKAGDDAADLSWFDVEALPELAFDHSTIIRDALIFARQLNWF